MSWFLYRFSFVNWLCSGAHFFISHHVSCILPADSTFILVDHQILFNFHSIVAATWNWFAREPCNICRVVSTSLNILNVQRNKENLIFGLVFYKWHVADVGKFLVMVREHVLGENLLMVRMWMDIPRNLHISISKVNLICGLVGCPLAYGLSFSAKHYRLGLS